MLKFLVLDTFTIFNSKPLTAMENKKRNPSVPILIIGTVVFGQQLTRIHYEHIRTVDYIVLCSSLIFIGVGIYVSYKNMRK